MAVARVDAAELADQRVARQLGEGAGHLDAGRSAADDDEREPRFAGCGVGQALGALEGADDARADVERVGQRLQAVRVPGPVVVAEVAVRRAGGHDEVVVGDRLSVVERHAARRGVDVGDFGLQHRQPAGADLIAQHVADRAGHRRRGEPRGRDLVQQRLEQVVVGAIEQRDVDVVLGQCAHRLQPAEAAADDEHPGSRRHCGFATGSHRPMTPAG